MSSPSSALLAINGFFMGNSVVYEHMSAKNVQQGQTDFMAWQQSSRISNVVRFALYVKDIANKTTNTNAFRRRVIVNVLSYPIPFALQILNHHVDEKYYPILKKNVVLARNHVEHAALVIDTLITGYFAIVISPIFGVGLLTGLAFQAILYSHKLPVKVKEMWEKCQLVIAFASIAAPSFLYDDGLALRNLISILLELGIFTYEHYFENKKIERLTEKQNVTIEQAKEIINTTISKFKVNPKHLNFRVRLPNNKDIDIVESMKNLACGIKWDEKNLSTFKAKLLDDPRFQSKHQDFNKQEDIRDDYAKELFYKGSKTLAQEIAEHKIKEGDAYIRYGILEEQLKAILNYLNDCKEDITDDLFTLAIDGGSYCASGKVRVIQELYETKVLSGADVQTKFLFWLT
ncbi:MAG: hypothetical protein WB791_09450, partial [Waddliaceae bacterium]